MRHQSPAPCRSRGRTTAASALPPVLDSEHRRRGEGCPHAGPCCPRRGQEAAEATPRAPPVNGRAARTIHRRSFFGRPPLGAAAMEAGPAKIRALDDAIRTTMSGGRAMLDAGVDAPGARRDGHSDSRDHDLLGVHRRQRPAPRARLGHFGSLVTRVRQRRRRLAGSMTDGNEEKKCGHGLDTVAETTYRRITGRSIEWCDWFCVPRKISDRRNA